MTAAIRHATYEDLLKVPDNLVAEIVDGELITSPRPASAHALATGGIYQDIGPFSRRSGGGGGPGGWWILFEPELHLGRDILVPDLAGWRRERMPVLRDVPYFELAPDWVCEVLSTSTARVDRVRKKPIYAREDVSHLWLVDPIARTLEVYRLDGGRWVDIGAYGGTELIRAEPFAAVEMDMSQWWLEEEAEEGEKR
ncbi:MAG: Uma2 family endonuclease [Deltaproteobacteria bacterium]|nr:Uma2 family endonuclease [Deltaproteobacteria bacterium]